MKNPEEGYISTFSGGRYYFLNPTEDQILIEDICNGLSIESRFNNCCSVFYSVLQHSINMCIVMPEKYKLEGLLHDWTEAYLKDIPKPLKNLLPDYVRLEKLHEEVGARKFKLEYPYPAIIKESDSRMAITEANALVKHTQHFYLYKMYKPFDIEIVPRNRQQLKLEFFALYNKYRRD